MIILDHVGFNVSDFATSKAFFVDSLKPLGIGIVAEGEGWVIIGENGKSQFWFGSFGASPGAIHLAFAAESRRQVREFHAAALAICPNGSSRPEQSDLLVAFVWLNVVAVSPSMPHHLG